MNTLENKYTSISISFSLRIQEFEKSNSLVTILYNDNSDNRKQMIDRISQIRSNKEGDLLVLNNGICIRLDQLISVDEGKRFTEKCGIDPDANPCGDASEY
jgi:hypothetical protein